MEFGLTEILVALGGVLTTWVFNNTKLREGITDYVLNKIGRSYNVNNHNVKTTLKSLKFESKLTDFDNSVKSELYHYYVDRFLTIMEELINNLLDGKKMSFQETKRFIKNNMYDKLILLNTLMDSEIILPDDLQEKFSKFRNYLTLQYTYAIEHALQAPTKKILLIQVLDAIENNSRWFLFYSTEMFNSFNGKFDSLKSEDIFINKK